MERLYISSIIAGELYYGIARRSHTRGLRLAAEELLRRVTVCKWDLAIAIHYGEMRSALETLGRPLAALDTLIAAHARALTMVLVSNDHAFSQVPELHIEDWTS